MFYLRNCYNKNLIIFIIISLLLFSFIIEKYHSHEDHSVKENCPVCYFKITTISSIAVCLFVIHAVLRLNFMLPEHVFVPYKKIIFLFHHLRAPPHSS